MKVLVTGANGMVARAAVAHCGAIGDEVIGLTRQELDISDAAAVMEKISDLLPDAILNCAAYTDVDGAEANEDAAYAANAAGVRNLAAAAKHVECAFVTISTDYVFDGTNTGFYTQRDTPSPLSAYGRSKLAGEVAARDTYARTIVVRSGWIYGEHGTNFLSVLPRLLAEGQNLKAIGDAFGTPTYAKDLAARLRELAELDLPCIYHVTNSGPGTSYLGFAQKVCEIAGFDESLLQPVPNDSLQRPARRPVSSKLACLFSERLGLASMPDWSASLEKFLLI